VDVDLQTIAEHSLRSNLERVEKHPDYKHPTYAEYSASFRKAKANGTMSDQPAPQYLQGAVIGLDNETGDILVLVGGRDFEHNQYDGAAGAGKIKEWRDRPDRHECGCRFSFAALFGGGGSFLASSVSGDISWQQRDHTCRARAHLHDISERRLASGHAAHFGTHRRKGWKRGMGCKERADPANCHQIRNGL